MGRCGIISVMLVSMLTLLTEIVFTVVIAYHLYVTEHLIVFCIIVGFLGLLSIVVQLLSWQLQSLRDTQEHSRRRQAMVVVLHVLQLGLLWRYGRIMTVHRLSLTRKELWETFALRTVHALCCTVPVLLLLMYLGLGDGEELRSAWQLWTALGVCFVSGAWGLAAFRKHCDYCCVVGAVFPGLAILFKAIWRLGEVTSRVLTLVMFVQVQGFWVFLLIGGHWITMLVLISVETVLQENSNTSKAKTEKCKTVACIFMKSYVYIFCYLNPCGNKSKFYTVVYYVITCLESLALLALWIIYEPRKELHIPLALVASISGAVGLCFGALYYSCFHRSGASHVDSSVDTACLTECIDCHRNSCNFRSTSGEDTTNYDTDWEQYIDQAAKASAANRLVAAPIDDHNVPAEACRRPHDMGYHNVLMSNHKGGQRSETPLVLMGYDQHAPQRPISHTRANSLDFLWDNYDLQLREHGHGVECLELQDIALKDQNKTYAVRSRRSLGQNTDQGYYSGISSSSKENSRQAAMAAILERDPVRHLVDLHAPPTSPDRLRCRARDGGALSDGNTSSYSTTSSQRAIVNCGKCGNSLSLENTQYPGAPSLYSLESSTSFASSAPSYYPRRRASIHVMDRGYYSRRRQQQRRRRLMERPMFGAEGPETLEQAMERIHGAGFPSYHRHHVLSSDVTSSAWDYTDSEV
jgi:hypothetical protein